ncbi:hypothetical protein R3P38DRAFT_2497663 [Favolaschia claudopus]|uniref:F-box domain-containing protein n=1 Tax=Favolaschia claudopus TaxID=2862362 RepID=A0AAW0E2X5_9AGAR
MTFCGVESPSLPTPVEPFLPLDLEREIFETAAVQDKTMIPILLRVCHRVNNWVEPMLYRVLIIENEDNSHIAALRSKPPHFRQTMVRHVFIDFTSSAMKPVVEQLSDFYGIESLAIDGHQKEAPSAFLDTLHPRKLSLWVASDASQWAQSTLSRPIFSLVTHLELYHANDQENTSWEHWTTLASFPALTHLSLVKSLALGILQDALQHCQHLEIAIIAFWDPSFVDQALDLAQDPPVSDPRLVIMMVGNIMDDWTIGTQGGNDFWRRAETFVAQKRLGKLGSSYLSLLSNAIGLITTTGSQYFLGD